MNINELFKIFKEWRSLRIFYYDPIESAPDPRAILRLIHNVYIKSIYMNNKDNIGDIDIEFNLEFFIPTERYNQTQKIIEDRWNMKNQYGIAEYYYDDEPFIFTLENYLMTQEKANSQEVLGWRYIFKCSAIIRDNIRTKIKEQIKERIDTNRFKLMEIE